MENSHESVKKKKLYYTMFMIIIAGTSNVIFISLQSKSFEEIRGAPYFHPWFLNLIMYIGEFYCSIYWSFQRKNLIEDENKLQLLKNENEIENQNSSSTANEDPSPFHFLVTCLLDIFSSTLQNFCLIFLSGSIFQMLMAANLIITSILSILFLKKYPKKYQIVAIIIVLVGLFLVGLSNLIYTQKEQESTQILGVLMLITSLFFTASQFIYQEKIIRKYNCHPMMVIAWESRFGLIITIAVLSIFEFIPCNQSWKDKVCSPLPDGRYFIENSLFALEQIGAHWGMIVIVIGSTFAVGSLNYFGISLTKQSTSLSRVIIYPIKTILVWIFFMIWPYTFKGREEFHSLQLTGFVIVIIGQLIYNQLVTINIGRLYDQDKKEQK